MTRSSPRSAASRRRPSRRHQAPAGLTNEAAAASGTGAATATSNSFATLLRSGLEQANQTELRANDLADKFERGVPGVDLPTVMLEANKANLSFRAVSRSTQPPDQCLHRHQ